MCPPKVSNQHSKCGFIDQNGCSPPSHGSVELLSPKLGWALAPGAGSRGRNLGAPVWYCMALDGYINYVSGTRK